MTNGRIAFSVGGTSLHQNLVDKTTVQTLSNKTLETPRLNEDVPLLSTSTELNLLDGFTAIANDNNMADATATKLATQQSIKAYVDGKAGDYQSAADNLSALAELTNAANKIPVFTDTAGTADTLTLNTGGLAATQDTIPSEQTVKNYVDATAAGLHVLEACRLATTVNINLTGTPDIDGETPAKDDRILVKHQAAKKENGIYVVTESGNWDRSTDFNTVEEIKAGDFTFVTSGDQGGHGYVMTSELTKPLDQNDSEDIVWSEFSGAENIIPGDGIAKSGNTISTDLKTNGGIVIESAKLAIDLEASSITGTLPVAKGGTGATTLNNLITLGTHTTGDYVKSLKAGTLIDLQDNSDETATPTIDVDLSEATEAEIADGDYILFLDTGGGGSKVGPAAKESLADLATLFAGSGLTTTNSVLNVIGGAGITANENEIVITPAQSAITSVINASLSVGRDADNQIKFSTDNQMIFRVDSGDGVIFKTGGEIAAASLDISGNADIDGTLEADAITINGTALDTYIAGVTVTNATNASSADNATTVTISDNESANESLPIVFDGGSGNLESDGNCTYNPSSGVITLNHPSTSGKGGGIGFGLNGTNAAIEVRKKSGSNDIIEWTGLGTGGIIFDGDITALASSDRRFKDDIKSIEDPLEKIKTMGGYTYTWNDLGGEHSIHNSGDTDVGVIAQEVEKIIPEAVTERENGYKAVQYEKLIPLLVECVKEQQIRIEKLQNDIDVLKK